MKLKINKHNEVVLWQRKFWKYKTAKRTKELSDDNFLNRDKKFLVPSIRHNSLESFEKMPLKISRGIWLDVFRPIQFQILLEQSS